MAATEVLAGPPVIVAEPEQPAAAKADPGVTVTGGVRAAQPEAIAREAARRDALAENAVALQIYDAYRPETWAAVDLPQAERHLGSRLLTVEGLPIDSVRIGSVNGRPAAIVVQRLPSDEPFEIVQWKQEDAERQAEGWVSVDAVSADQAPAEQPEARAAKRMPELLTSVIARDGFLLALRAPVSADSLAVLAGRIR